MNSKHSIVQSEAAECGLACLAMIAAHHGQHLGLRELRGRFPLSLKGANLSRLIEVAGQLGLQARPLRLELDELDQLRTPCILHWDLNHFVVLARVRGARATVLDPAAGERTLSLAEVSKHFTGVAMELSPVAGFERVAAPPTIALSQLTGRVTGLWRSLGLLLGLSAALQVFVLVAPFFMQGVVDQVLVSADRDLLTVLGLAFAASVLFQAGIGLLRGWAVVYLSTRLGLQWMGNVFHHLLRLPMNFFGKRHLGDIVSRMGSVQSIQRTLSTSFVEAIIDGLMTVATLAMLLIYSWKLAGLTLLAVALYLGLRVLAFRAMRDGTEQQLIAAARQQSFLLESIRGMQSLKLSGREASREAGYGNLMNESLNRDVWLANLGLKFSGVSQLIFGLERVAVIWIGAKLAMDNVFSVGMLIAYLSYKDQFSGRVSGLIDKGMELRMLRLHGERLADIVLEAPEPQTAPRTLAPAADAAAIATDIDVRGLSYRYAEGEPWVLRDCNLRVAEGESVAIVGASGCGKTTLIKLMLGLTTPGEGAIAVGGHDIGKLGLRAYRGMIGVVMQDDQLFAGSIAENIGFDDDCDPARVEAAARLAGVHEDIVAMPMGYHGLIGDMGSSLSGGQKQRLILARALYRQPRILFLDEATSHLDVHSERLVNQAVAGLALTRVIIAHRPDTIASADRVLVMADGRIVEEYRPADRVRNLGERWREAASKGAAAGAPA
ncbi:MULTISPECIES: peptidase domain-containing ABC transporter [unclassified Lysobacter]|uniref:peptidase domain-containing ABC transporter n=1 Tax=unclassified Lysobacter TaxID=2635362 RepID=UPI001BE9E9D2|nr:MULTISPECIES: peptidase domain-containing ABC transporter [unclassified Lysobacter]MBT2750230.1 peptidase domain-containing ABC transporter [Lysobacter sp. ISL-50]MBT2775199.1 peptidase domain-containing ABC transporter [Lysobacter sp. ISL-54]MBT2782572.1 peptidase domain-containing ABC transporter [Lysobacter sp. ISL-52]